MNPIPFFFVGKEITNQRIELFLNGKHQLLTADLGRMDTKSVWYSKEHIEKLLEEIETAGGDGLRICLGTYESTHEFAGQLCLLMVSTKENTISDTPAHINHYLEDQPDYADRSALPRGDAFKGKGTKRDFNFGSPCPPRCD